MHIGATFVSDALVGGVSGTVSDELGVCSGDTVSNFLPWWDHPTSCRGSHVLKRWGSDNSYVLWR